MHDATRIPLMMLLTLLTATAATLTVACRRVPSAPPQAGPPEVVTATMAAQALTLTTELPGRTSAYLVAEIRPQVSGILLERAFTEGAAVKAGALLYQIDPSLYQAAYDQAAAALAVAEANLPAARSRAERLEGLVAIRAVGEQDADDAAAALAQAEAGVAAARAALASAQINLSYTPLRAPISGRIGRSTVTVGALVTAYQPVPLAVIQQLDPIYVDVTQSSAELLRLRRQFSNGEFTRGGDSAREVELLLEDGTAYPLTGKLAFQDVTVDPSTGSVTLRIVFPNPDHVLLPGMYVRAVVEEGVSEQAILVPQQGVSRDVKGNPVVLVVNGEGVVEQRLVTLDRALGDRWLVSSGLAVGDRVIVEGVQKVRPGAPVRVVPAAAGPSVETR